VLFDEPAAGLDSTETAELGGLLRRVRDRGTGVLLIDHDMDLVLEVCDRIYVLDFGRIIASGAPSAIRADQKVIDAYLGAPA
jgi:ABC-type branched-subunit amino acid transport system ATPase component